jgi:hypothetical protein
MSSYIALSYWQLAATSVFVLIDAALSVLLGLRVHRGLLFAARPRNQRARISRERESFLFVLLAKLRGCRETREQPSREWYRHGVVLVRHS